MKKIFCGAVLFLAFVAAAFASRAEIEEAIQAYEAIVIEAETLAARPLINAADFTALDEKAQAAGPRINAVQNEQEWLIQDAKRMAGLRARFNQAIAIMAQNLLKF